MHLEEILSFTKFLTKFREVVRKLEFSHDPRPENDAEHCRQLAMVAWYIISSNNLLLSLEKVLKYCVVHDIVEIYAGDTDAMRRTPEQENMKQEKEKAAMIQLQNDFPE